MIESIKLTNGKEIKLTEDCPECGGYGEYWRDDYESDFPCDICKGTGKVQRYITPAQYKEITGEDLPDGFLVWCNYKDREYDWWSSTYSGTIGTGLVIVLALGPAPSPDWRPE